MNVPRFSFGATPESVARWTVGRDARLGPPPEDGAPLPLSYLVFLRVQPLLGVSMHKLLERDPDRGLYGGVTYRAERTPRVGEVFIADARVRDRREIAGPRGTLVLRTLETRYSDPQGTVVSEAVRMVDLPPGPAPAPRPVDTPSPYPKLAELAPFTRTQIAWLTVETGDTNPLHLDHRYAASRGYRDVVVPGTLTAAVLERELGAALQRSLRMLDLRLLAPCYPEEALSLHAAPQGEHLAFQLYAGAERRAEGSAA